MILAYKEWLRGVACVLALGVGLTVHAATVTFSNINSASGLFVPLAQVGDALPFDVSGFSASAGAAASNPVSFDTVAFLVTADPGYYITSIKYTEGGTATTDASSFAAATATWVVDGSPSSLGFHAFPQNSSQATFDLTSSTNLPNLTNFAVSITNNLFAAGTSASISKTAAIVEVVTVPIPEPASLLYLLAGLGMVAFVMRRKLA